MKAANGPAPALKAAVDEAQRFFVAGDDEALAAVLHPIMDGIDPQTSDADPVLAHAALLLLNQPGDMPFDRMMAWASYAHTTLTECDDYDHQVAAWSAGIWAVLLRESGRHDQALAVLRDLLTTLHGAGDEQLLLLARSEIAETLHYAGNCTEAIHEITEAWTTWQRTHSDNTGLGLDLIRVYITLLLGCQRTKDARTMIAVAATLFGPGEVFTNAIAAQLITRAATHAMTCAADTTVLDGAGTGPR
jgi:hypothetical protein